MCTSVCVNLSWGEGIVYGSRGRADGLVRERAVEGMFTRMGEGEL